MSRRKIKTEVFRDRHEEWTKEFCGTIGAAVQEHGADAVLNPHTERVYKRCLKELTSGPEKA